MSDLTIETTDLGLGAASVPVTIETVTPAGTRKVAQGPDGELMVDTLELATDDEGGLVVGLPDTADLSWADGAAGSVCYRLTAKSYQRTFTLAGDQALLETSQPSAAPDSPSSMRLDDLADVSASASTPAGKVLGTTSEGEWGPVDAPGGAVDSVNGQTGVVVLDAADVGADAAGTAASAVAAEALLARNADNITSGTVDDARIPSGITRDTEMNVAISAAINALLDGAPSALDTLNELAAAVNDDASFAASVTSALATKQPLDTDLSLIAALTTTTFGRALLTAADAAAARSSIDVDQAGTNVPKSLVDAKGDLLVGTADNTVGRLAAPSTAGHILTASDGAGTLGWAASPDTTKITENTQTADYTLAISDAGKVVGVNKATSAIVTIPANTSVAIPVDTVIELCQEGVGPFVVTADPAVTLNGVAGGSVWSVQQYASVFLRKRGTDEWVAIASAGASSSMELGSATATTDFTQTGAGNSLVTGLQVTVTVGSRPLLVMVSAKIQHTVSGSAVALSIEEDGTQVVDAGWTCPANSAVGSIHRAKRTAPAAGTHTYRVRITTTGSGNGLVLASATSPALLEVLQL